MMGIIKSLNYTPARTFKNFGHKRDPEPIITVLWHGFLTFSFIGILINWKWIGNFFVKHSTENSEELASSENIPSN